MDERQKCPRRKPKVQNAGADERQKCPRRKQKAQNVGADERQKYPRRNQKVKISGEDTSTLAIREKVGVRSMCIGIFENEIT